MNGSRGRVRAWRMVAALGFLTSLIAGPSDLQGQEAAEVFHRFAPAVAKLGR